jgi:hypothetical protein
MRSGAAFAALIMALLLGCKKGEPSDAPKVDLATVEVKKLAFEAFPQWAASHPSALCPEKIDELYEFMSEKGGTDPWGQPYRMYCGATLPPGARGLAISSSGPDRKEDTADDIKSWK